MSGGGSRLGFKGASLEAVVRPLLKSDLLYDVLVTRSLDRLRTRRTIKATRTQLIDIRRRFGTGEVRCAIPGGLEMEFDLSDALDAFMYDHISRLGGYEPEVGSVLSRLVTPSTIFVDVGANVGYFTLLCARSAKRVYALEPVEPVFRRLKRNVEINSLENVVALNAAASREGGAVRLFESRISPGHTSSVKRPEHGGSAMFEAVRLDDVVDARGDVVMKVDVEGSEMDVLLGATRLFASGSVTAVVVEWARGLYPNVSSLRERFAFYSSLGSVQLLDETEGPRRVVDRGELPEVCNLLVSVGGERSTGPELPQRL